MIKLIYKKAKKSYLKSNTELSKEHFNFQLPGSTYYDAICAYKRLIEEINGENILFLEGIYFFGECENSIDCANVILFKDFKKELDVKIEGNITIGDAIGSVGEKYPIYRLYKAQIHEEKGKFWITDGLLAEHLIV